MTWIRQKAPHTIKFHSITKQLTDERTSDTHQCPHCCSEIDFGRELEWMGPSAFICGSCGQVVELRDLGFD